MRRPTCCQVLAGAAGASERGWSGEGGAALALHWHSTGTLHTGDGIPAAASGFLEFLQRGSAAFPYTRGVGCSISISVLPEVRSLGVYASSTPPKHGGRCHTGRTTRGSQRPPAAPHSAAHSTHDAWQASTEHDVSPARHGRQATGAVYAALRTTAAVERAAVGRAQHRGAFSFSPASQQQSAPSPPRIPAPPSSAKLSPSGTRHVNEGHQRR